MQTVSLETVILRVVEQVVRELKNQGIQIVPPNSGAAPDGNSSGIERVDMTGYKTPVLTERHVLALREQTGTVVVPKGTVVSPKARERLRDRNIALRVE